MESNPAPVTTQDISAASSRMAARLFSLGNIIAMLPGLVVAPIILLGQPERTSMIFMFILMVVPPILWFGLSIIVYIIARHHPNPRVGHYTQWAAYRFYGMFGIVIPVGTFYGTQWQLWIATGGLIALILIPWSLLDLFRIQREQWQDITIEGATT
ncbi:MAG: hypothetical protein OEU74_08040 [Gammaproteobacteria bacterium]|nr:hypothetical protein [Gammaproteobacteria bacterium]